MLFGWLIFFFLLILVFGFSILLRIVNFFIILKNKIVKKFTPKPKAKKKKFFSKQEGEYVDYEEIKD